MELGDWYEHISLMYNGGGPWLVNTGTLPCVFYNEMGAVMATLYPIDPLFPQAFLINAIQ